MGVLDIPNRMTLTEAGRLATELLGDPSSRTFAAVHEWDHPVSREWLLAADQFDAYAKVNFKKPAPYARPFGSGGPKVHRSGTPRSIVDFEALLVANGIGRPQPAGGGGGGGKPPA